MKTLKITLIIAVVAAIVFFVIWSFQPNDALKTIPLAENLFTRRISQEIDSLNKLPDCKFSKEFYNEIDYHINDYHKNKKLGKTVLENDQQKEILSKILYAKYADKFIRQAFCVFRGSEWKIDDLNFIRSECQGLRNSILLQKGSPVDQKFREIQDILRKYDDVAGFISSCKGFSYTQIGLQDRFPIFDIEKRISQAASFLNNGSGNNYMKNCTRLRNDLNILPQWLFDAHVRYLDNKIASWSGMYSDPQLDFKNQKQYATELHSPLQSEIGELDNAVYKVANFDQQLERLSNKWKAEGESAYKYFNK